MSELKSLQKLIPDINDHSFIEILRQLHDDEENICYVQFSPLKNGSLTELGYYAIPKTILLEIIHLGENDESIADVLIEIRHSYKTKPYGKQDKQYLTLKECLEEIRKTDAKLEEIHKKDDKLAQLGWTGLMEELLSPSLVDFCKLVPKTPDVDITTLTELGFSEHRAKAVLNFSPGFNNEYADVAYTTTRIEIRPKNIFVSSDCELARKIYIESTLLPLDQSKVNKIIERCAALDIDIDRVLTLLSILDKNYEHFSSELYAAIAVHESIFIKNERVKNKGNIALGIDFLNKNFPNITPEINYKEPNAGTKRITTLANSDKKK